MSQKEDVEADERDNDTDEDRESDPPSQPEPALKKKATGKRGQKATPAVAKSAGVPTTSVGLLVVAALAVGGAVGWFAQIQQAKAAAAKVDAAAPAGSSGAETGPCASWRDKICSSSGKESAACQEAKGATGLLTPSTCAAGLVAMPATLSKIKAARASCDKLVSKLCTDLPPGSETCAMVKEKTPSFPSQRCDEMMEHYDEVIGQLKQIDQQGGPQMGGAHGPGGPGMRPGMPPH